MKNAVTEIITAYEKLKPAGAGVIAIDGRAASGKTTLAAALAAETGGAVVHMDDFFLPAELRTPQRLAAPGGNVHAERFAEEVLPFLRQGRPFCYRRFDCRVMDYGRHPGGDPRSPRYHRGGCIQSAPAARPLRRSHRVLRCHPAGAAAPHHPTQRGSRMADVPGPLDPVGGSILFRLSHPANRRPHSLKIM